MLISNSHIPIWVPDVTVRQPMTEVATLSASIITTELEPPHAVHVADNFFCGTKFTIGVPKLSIYLTCILYPAAGAVLKII